MFTPFNPRTAVLAATVATTAMAVTGFSMPVSADLDLDMDDYYEVWDTYGGAGMYYPQAPGGYVVVDSYDDWDSYGAYGYSD